MEESISQFNSSSNLITINEEYRDESPEALAHALIWPLASLHAISERGGSPRSYDECIADRTAAHSAQALWWFGNYFEGGKPNPTQLEQWANNNLARRYVDKNFGDWVREAYRESCASYGEPPPPTATPTPVDTLAATIAKCSEANANDWEYYTRRSFELSGMRGDLLKKWMSQSDKYIQTAEFMCVRYQQAGHEVADVSRFAGLYITSQEFRAAVFDAVYPTLNDREFYTLSRILCTLPTHEFCRWSQKD